MRLYHVNSVPAELSRVFDAPRKGNYRPPEALPDEFQHVRGHFWWPTGLVSHLLVPTLVPQFCQFTMTVRLLEKDTVVSYQSERFSSKWELPFLPPSSLEWWRKERARKAALILMKISHFDRTLRYLCWTITKYLKHAKFYLRDHHIVGPSFDRLWGVAEVAWGRVGHGGRSDREKDPPQNHDFHNNAHVSIFKCGF